MATDLKKSGKTQQKLTPLMKQYFDVKRKHPDAILLFRVGDFYETFGEDAIKASQILGIVLTSRNNGGSDIELAGFPHHSVELYLPKLVKAGYRVAICEQLEKPSKEKKIVKRDVTELVTPGVTINDSILSSRENNFVCSIISKNERWGIACLDISTGEFYVYEASFRQAQSFLQSFKASEFLYSKSQKDKIEPLLDPDSYRYGLDEWFYEYEYNRDLLLKQFEVLSLKGFGIEKLDLAQIAAGTVIHYLSSIHHRQLSHVHKIVRIESGDYMWLDRFTIQNLEILRTNHESGNSLLDIMDKTRSPMGARLLSRWIVMPLKDKELITGRHTRVQEMIDNPGFSEFLAKQLKAIGDIERLSSKIPLRKINPKELFAISQGLERTAQLKDEILRSQSEQLGILSSRLDGCRDFVERVQATLDENAGYKLAKPGYIKEGWNEELDDWRSVSSNSKEILLDLQKEEAQRTGISSLKVGFNSVFGYYFEVTNKYKNQDLIPEDWVRKQTLKGSERYINDALKQIETRILQAEERILELEEKLFNELLDVSDNYIKSLMNNAQILAELDCYLCFAMLALEKDYVKPEMDDSFILDIKEGRHPVIESRLGPDDPYVPNDVFLDPDSEQIIMITGPNMSGKSAVLRQTALICLMAHMGSFVPARSARIGIVDKLFTRVGASDNISSGESTFMVEMNETASILNNLSRRSLIILDEIGRGTSTYDGISIAWAIAEYLHGLDENPKTLFATHYHELSALESLFDRIRNYNVSTRELDNKVIFLRKLIPGTCASSFGIHVAQMAGMPIEVISRANTLLRELESKTLDQKQHIDQSINNSHKNSQQFQMQLFDESNKIWLEIKSELDRLDLPSMTPIECMLKLKELSDKLKEHQA